MSLNQAGGYTFVTDDMTRLTRFLILGSNGPTYSIGERQLTKENLEALERLLTQEGIRCVLDLLLRISEEGRAVSNDPALFALARLCAFTSTEPTPILKKDGTPAGKNRVRLSPEDLLVRRLAYAVLPRVARTGTHLLHFMAYVKQFRGNGPMQKKALQAWYQGKPLEEVVYQVLKYQSRDGWSQRDILRLIHPKPETKDENLLYQWVTRGWETLPEPPPPTLQRLWAYEQVKRTTDEEEIARLIRAYDLPREAVPSHALTAKGVWEALLERMPLEALLRNLATMTRLEVLVPDTPPYYTAVARLQEQEALKKARLHPVKILSALFTYARGRGERGDHTWKPLRGIEQALSEAFYRSFEYVEPTGKRILLAIDVSGSMHGTAVNGLPHVPCHTAAAVLAMVLARREKECMVMGFDTEMYALQITPEHTLEECAHIMSHIGGGGTQCALPILWALAEKHIFDGIVLLTDSETWYGSPHTFQALQEYRKQVNAYTRFVSVQMTSTATLLIPPDDPLSLTMVGFDTTGPQVLHAFLQGEV